MKRSATIFLFFFLSSCNSYIFNSLFFSNEKRGIVNRRITSLDVYIPPGSSQGFGPTKGASPSTRPAKMTLKEPVFEDMEYLAIMLANITEVMDIAPEQALTIVSRDMGWLYSRDVPKLTQMLLNEVPSVRQDNAMMRAYMFLMDFLEAVGNETTALLKQNQETLRKLMENAKLSEKALNDHIAANSDKLLKPEFAVYLDAEISAQDTNTPMENLLVTIKLRLLDEYGKTLGVDVMLLPKLASEEDPSELKRKTVEYLEMYDDSGKTLFLQTLRLMMGEMAKRYDNVDPLLIMNMREIEKITQSMIQTQR
jgi:hypothetical protein